MNHPAIYQAGGPQEVVVPLAVAAVIYYFLSRTVGKTTDRFGSPKNKWDWVFRRKFKSSPKTKDVLSELLKNELPNKGWDGDWSLMLKSDPKTKDAMLKLMQSENEYQRSRKEAELRLKGLPKRRPRRRRK